MAKRPNRIPPIEHNRQQLELLKTLTPNDTPDYYKPLSNGLVDVAISALDIVAALETQTRPDIERLYDLVDGLADLVEEAEPQSTPTVSVSVTVTEQRETPVAKPGQGIAGITAMKTTIVGRPDQVEVQGDTVIVRLTYTPRVPSTGNFGLPKGVPSPQMSSTPVIAYVGKKQFEKVKAQLDNPEDMLIIEGAVSQVIDGTLTVYASNITSKLLQMAKAEQQKTAQ